MAQYGSFPADITSKPDFVRCGQTANLLWFAGRACADSYGRLPANPQRLKAGVLAQWVFEGQITEEEIEESRDRLIQAGFWIVYEVKGELYVEYRDWDDDQSARSLLGRRGKPAFPDPPGRPALAYANRPHKPSTRKEQPESSTDPHGSADLPAESSSRVPPREEEQGVAPTSGVVADRSAPATPGTAIGQSDGLDWVRWHEQRFATAPSATDVGEFSKLQARGITDELIIAVIEKAIAERARLPVRWAKGFITNLIPHGVKTVTDWERHEQHQGAGDLSTTADNDRPPDEDEDPLTARARAQAEQLRQTHAAS